MKIENPAIHLARTKPELVRMKSTCVSIAFVLTSLEVLAFKEYAMKVPIESTYIVAETVFCLVYCHTNLNCCFHLHCE